MRSINDVPSTLSLREQVEELRGLGVAEWQIAKRFNTSEKDLREALVQQEKRANTPPGPPRKVQPSARTLQRMEVVREWTAAGKSTSQIAAHLGVNWAAVSVYRKRIREAQQ